MKFGMMMSAFLAVVAWSVFFSRVFHSDQNAVAIGATLAITCYCLVYKKDKED